MIFSRITGHPVEASCKITDRRFARYGCDSADFTALERIDDAALPYIWVADKPDRDLLLVRM